MIDAANQRSLQVPVGHETERLSVSEPRWFTGKEIPTPKIALVRGPIVASQNALNNEATPSIAYAYIAGYLLNAGYECEIVDSIAEGLNNFWAIPGRDGFFCQGLTFDEAVAMIPKDTGIIGISAMFSGEWPVTRELVRRIRKEFPRALIIGGGEHITALCEYSLRDCEELDVCVKGEGEQIFFELVEAFRRGDPISMVGGLAYLDAANAYVETGPLKRIREINDIPWPYWPKGYMEKFWEHGKSYGVLTERDMPIMASRGCPYQCTFCSNPQMWTTRYVLRDQEDLIAEIKSYISRYNITALQFYDLTAITKKKWTVKFCEMLIEEGIKLKWSLPSGTRSEALDDEVLGLLYKTGCNYLVYAPESGSPRTLEKIKKRIDLKKLTKSVLTAKKNRLTLRTNLIIGFPEETRGDVFRTIAYGIYLAARGVDEVSINIFSPYPGTEIFDKLVSNGALTINDDYFFGLSSLNSEFSNLNPMTCNEKIGARELAIYRLFFLLSNYAVGYLFYPHRILRTLKSIFSKNTFAATVFEHRLKDLLKKKSSSESSVKGSS